MSAQGTCTPAENRALELLAAAADGWLTEEDREELLSLLRNDPLARAVYAEHAMLQSFLHHKARSVEGSGFRVQGSGIQDSGLLPDLPVITPLPTTHYPLLTNFVGGPVFSYMVATVVLCLMLLGGWAYKINHDRNAFVNNSRRSTTSGSLDQPELVFVGRITGVKDCRWTSPASGAYVGASIPLGREYALPSGLVEITYKTGAKVILEGPCIYKVTSSTGGFLARGKLTANIRGQRSEHSSLIPHSSCFVVKTPTAIVTDLGTEFGVEVDENGNTTSHVFQGTVKVQAVGDGSHKELVLQVNESVQVEKRKDAVELSLHTGDNTVNVPKFVRRMIEPPKQLDLLDIIAGGNGTGRRRERGIDPVSGMEDPKFVTNYRGGDRQYRPVTWHRMIDGVFVPDGSAGAVQLDSAGHEFKEFPPTEGRIYGSIWSRAADVGEKRKTITRSWTYVMTNAEQFMPERRGLLVFYANMGITFDLEAMRKRYPDSRPARFRAIAGMAFGPDAGPEVIEAGLGLIDLWVFVDGRLELKREKLRMLGDTVNLDVKLGPNDRFLTLVATDGGNGIAWDCVVVGEPVLEMTSTENQK